MMVFMKHNIIIHNFYRPGITHGLCIFFKIGNVIIVLINLFLYVTLCGITLYIT